MAIKLTKGGRINLNKEEPGLDEIMVGLGWDANNTDTGGDFDLDVSVLVLNENNKPVGTDEESFVYYNNKSIPGIQHMGDNRTGAGEGDDEEVKIKLSDLKSNVNKIVFLVSIYQAEERKQNFGMVENAYIRLVNEKTGKEIAKYDLSEDFSTEICVDFGELYKKSGEWRFKAVGMGQKEGLVEYLKQYGFQFE